MKFWVLGLQLFGLIASFIISIYKELIMTTILSFSKENPLLKFEQRTFFI